MSVSFLPYVRGDERDLWMIPMLARDDGDAFEVSVSNCNAVGLLLELRMPRDSRQSFERALACSFGQIVRLPPFGGRKAWTPR
jgi:hypothetical protein